MQWSQLKQRERMWVMVLAAAVFLGLYARFVDQPISRRVSEYKASIRRSEAQLRDLRTKQPQDTELAKKIEKTKEEEVALIEELAAFEKQVPSSLYTSQLVGEFTRLAREVKLESIKQRVVKEQTYSRIILEVGFYASYIDAVNYMAAVEGISPFLRIEEFEILEPVGKTIELGGAPVKLVVSCLLTDSDKAMAIAAGEPKSLGVKRDILSSSAKPADVMDDAKFNLEGITFDSKNPTAIINGDVFAVNSELAGYKIKKILADTVVLSDGVEDHLLSLKPGAEKAK